MQSMDAAAGARLVNEVGVGDLVHALVQERAGHEAGQPLLAVVRLLLGERQLQRGLIIIACTKLTSGP